MPKTSSLLIGLACAILCALPAGAVLGQPAPAYRAPDYANPALWLCLPGRADACRVDQSATIVSANGALRLEEFNPPKKPPLIDCFYVYPTVSEDAASFSDLIAGPEERRAVAAQFARFSAACRTFAPIYRQLTLSGLRDEILDGGSSNPLGGSSGSGGPYGDVLAAWREYMARDNGGRGVVLIGHSQGAALLTRLIQEEIEGRPLQGRLVSAILLGGGVQVAAGADGGGTFRALPLCRSDRQTACIIAYSSYRDTDPPTAAALFGRSRPGQQAACVNPANLKTGKGEPESYFPAARPNDDQGRPQGWVTPYQPIGTPFVKTPGLVTTTCVSQGGFTYLSVHLNGRPRDVRTSSLSGDMTLDNRFQPGWGLHLIDVNLSLGDLVDVVAAQGRAWKPPR